MAELYVRTVDKINEDFYLNLQCTKRGDVIVICPDGWAWGKEELGSPEHTIIKLPGVPVDDVAHLLAPEPQTDPKNPSATLQRRLHKIDLDDQKIISGEVLDTAKIALVTITKEPVEDPRKF